MKKENTRRSLKTAIYVRVSTDEQAQEGYSIRAQTDKLKAYALLKDWEIFDIYADEGISGKNIVDRPAINRLIDDINDGKVQNVLVFKVDRLTRSTKNLLELVELFEECDCAFNSLTESIDTDTPSGRMFLKIIGIFAEFERENLISRLKLGFERKAKEGYCLGRLSYGYTRENGQKIQTILPSEAKIVKEIFTMYVEENKSMTYIAKSLNKRKIPTKSSTSSWDSGRIKMMLTNPIYIGKVRYSLADERRYFEVDGQHEQILADEIFMLAQEKVAHMPKISRTKRPREMNYFCGVLLCSCCGSKFTTHNYKNKAGENKCLYRCVKNATFSTGDGCKALRIGHEKMDAAFIEYIRNINDFTETNDIEIDNDKTKKEQELQDYIKECERKLDNLVTRKKKFMEQYVSADISFEEYKEMIDAFNEKFIVLEQELAQARTDLPTIKEAPDIAQADIIANIKENWDYLNNSEKMMFLQRFIKKIIIKVEKESSMRNTVKIESVELNSVIEPIDKKQGKTATRGSLIDVQVR